MDEPHPCLNRQHNLDSVGYLRERERDRERNMELGGEEVGGGEYKQTIFYVLFKSSNNEKVNLKKKINFITT